MSPTKRQLDALRFIRGYQLAKGYSPTFREVANGIGLSSGAKATVSRELDALECSGWARRLRNREQAIEVLADISVPRAPDGAPLYFVEIGG